MKFSVTIKNWEKFNPRNDVKHPHWFRLSNEIITAQDLFGLTFEEKWIWISILCLASQKQSENLDLESTWLAHYAKTSEDAIFSTLQKLSENECVTHTLRARNVHVRKRTATEQNRTLQNRTKEYCSNAAHSSDRVRASLDFDALYKKYPHKVGKAKGLQICRREIRVQADYDDLARAIDKFCEYHASRGTEPKFLPHFKTFMGSWRDWLDEETGSATGPPERKLSDILREEEAKHDTG